MIIITEKAVTDKLPKRRLHRCGTYISRPFLVAWKSLTENNVCSISLRHRGKELRLFRSTKGSCRKRIVSCNFNETGAWELWGQDNQMSKSRLQCTRLAGANTVTAPYISGCPTVAPAAGTPYASFSRCHWVPATRGDQTNKLAKPCIPLFWYWRNAKQRVLKSGTFFSISRYFHQSGYSPVVTS